MKHSPITPSDLDTSEPYHVNATPQDRHSLLLLLSILLLLIVGAFVTNDRTGDSILLISMYVILGAATLELSQKRSSRWATIILASCSMPILLVCIFHPIRWLLIAGWLLLAVFFGTVSVGLFSYLGRSGPITNDRLYASVSLYLILAIFYFAIFNVIQTAAPGAFVETGLSPPNVAPRHSLLYLSLATLTTLGYGDVVPVSPPARIVAALEAATGVLYIAITVARLVAAHQKTD